MQGSRSCMLLRLRRRAGPHTAVPNELCAHRGAPAVRAHRLAPAPAVHRLSLMHGCKEPAVLPRCTSQDAQTAHVSKAARVKANVPANTGVPAMTQPLHSNSCIMSPPCRLSVHIRRPRSAVQLHTQAVLGPRAAAHASLSTRPRHPPQ